MRSGLLDRPRVMEDMVAENESPQDEKVNETSAVKSEAPAEGTPKSKADLGSRLRASGKMPDDADKPKVGPLDDGPKYRNLSEEEVAELARKMEEESNQSGQSAAAEQQKLAKLFEEAEKERKEAEKRARSEQEKIAEQFRLEQKRARAEAKLAELRAQPDKPVPSLPEKEDLSVSNAPKLDANSGSAAKPDADATSKAARKPEPKSSPAPGTKFEESELNASPSTTKPGPVVSAQATDAKSGPAAKSASEDASAAAQPRLESKSSPVPGTKSETSESKASPSATKPGSALRAQATAAKSGRGAKAVAEARKSYSSLAASEGTASSATSSSSASAKPDENLVKGEGTTSSTDASQSASAKPEPKSVVSEDAGSLANASPSENAKTDPASMTSAGTAPASESASHIESAPAPNSEVDSAPASARRFETKSPSSIDNESTASDSPNAYGVRVERRGDDRPKSLPEFDLDNDFAGDLPTKPDMADALAAASQAIWHFGDQTRHSSSEPVSSGTESDTKPLSGFSSRYDLNAGSKEPSTTQSPPPPPEPGSGNYGDATPPKRKKQTTGSHKLLDFTGSLQQEQKKINSMRTTWERTQIVASLVTSFVVNNAFLVGGITTGVITGGLLIANYALINSKNSYKEGMAHFDKHENADAVKLFDKAIFFHHYYTKAYIYRGRAYLNMDNTKRAYEDLTQALSLDPNNLEALLYHSYVCVRLQLGEEALNDLSKIEKRKPDLLTERPETLIAFSQAYLMNGNYNLALAEIDECVRHFKNNGDVLVQKARCFQAVKNYPEALLVCNKAIRVDPNDGEAYAEAGHTYQLMNDYQHDKTELDKAIAVDPNVSSAHKYLAEHYLHQYQFGQAVEEANQEVRLNGSAQSLLDRADVLTKSGDAKAALSDYDRATSQIDFHRNGNFFMKRAHAKSLLSKTDEALQDIQTAADIDPKNSSRYMIEKADILAASKRFREAIEELNRVLAKDPDNAEALFKHGWYSELDNNNITAMDDYFKAIKIDPHNAQAYFRRGYSYFQKNQFNSAAADFQRALQLDPNLQEAKEKLQVCLSQTKQLATTTPMRTGQIDASAAEKADIAKMDFAELLQKGYAALQAGRTAYALEALSRAVKVNPNDKNARQYLFDALLAAQQPELATTQLLAMEKIGGVTIDDEIAMVNAYIEVKANDAARTVIDHLIERYATDGDALLKIAQHCSDDWSFYDKGTKAAEIGMAHIKDPLLAAKLKSMHDVVAGKLAQKGAKPVETSIYKGGDGEANAPK